MEGDAERRVKRSRFDEKASAEKRRSASPERKTSTPPVSDAAAAAKKKAAEAAARLSAMLKTKQASTPVVPSPPAPSPVPRPPADDVNEHGFYVRDIEVNDLRNRYLVVKESTIQEIKTKTGADIEVRGKYYPDKSMATERDPPMFLHISSPVKTKMEAAVGMANKLINSELGPLVDERRFRKKEDFERDELGRRKWPEEKVPVDMPPIRGFQLRASIVGHGGENVKYVQSQTQTRIQIKGHGSGFIDAATDQEADEPMHLHITGPDASEVHRAKGMIEDLVASVRVKYDDYKTHGPRDDDDRRDRGGDRYGSPAQAQGSPAPYATSSYPAPPPGAAIAPPFGYSSAPPPPPGSSSYGAPPPPPGAPGTQSSSFPPGPPGTSYGSSYSSAPPGGDEYDPYAPSRSYARPPGT